MSKAFRRRLADRTHDALFTHDIRKTELSTVSWSLIGALAISVAAYAGIEGTEPAPPTHMSYQAAYYEQQQTHPGSTIFACETGRIIMRTNSEGHVYVRTIAEDTSCQNGPVTPQEIDQLTE